MTMTTGLEDVLGLPREINVGGEVLALKPLRIGQLPAFARAISPIIATVSTPPIDWLRMLGEHGDTVLVALAIAIDRPPAWVEQLDAGEALLLITQVIEINADFFTHQVLPQFNRLMAPTGAPVAPTGAPESPPVAPVPPPQPAGSTPSSA